MSARERSETFAPELVSVREGRHFVRDTLEQWGLAEVVDDAQLCVSEIITNAVCHAGTELTVSIRCHGELTVEVHDGSAELVADATPTVESAPLDATSGRGLHIVSVLSRAWGVRSEPDGKVVWFQLPLPSSDSVDDRSDDTVVAMRSRGGETPADASRHPSQFGQARATA